MLQKTQATTTLHLLGHQWRLLRPPGRWPCGDLGPPVVRWPCATGGLRAATGGARDSGSSGKVSPLLKRCQLVSRLQGPYGSCECPQEDRSVCPDAGEMMFSTGMSESMFSLHLIPFVWL